MRSYALDDVRLKSLAAPNQKISGKFKNYRWSESGTMMDVFVFAPAGTRVEQLVVDIRRTHLHVGIKGSPDEALLAGALFGKVRASECWWVVAEEDGLPCVHLQLAKMPPDDKLWGNVLG